MYFTDVYLFIVYENVCVLDRFVFPFEDHAENKQLVSLDEGVEATLPPYVDK